MRGKTNIPPRKAPAINGDVENFVVANGNTIAKGDFVSYVLNSQSVPFDSRDMEVTYKYEYDEVNHKFFVVFNLGSGYISTGLVMLLQVINGDLVVLDSKQINPFMCTCIEGTSVYVARPSGNTSASYIEVVVDEYSILSDEFVFVQSYATQYVPKASGSGYSRGIIGMAVKKPYVYINTRYGYSPSSGNGFNRIETYRGELGDTLTQDNDMTLATIGYKSYSKLKYYSYVVGNYIIFVTYIGGTSAYDGSNTTIVDAVNQVVVSNNGGNVVFLTCEMFGTKLCLIEQANEGVRIFDFNNGVLTPLYTGYNTSNRTSFFIGRTGLNKFVVLDRTTPYTTREFEFGETVLYVDNQVNVGVNGKNGVSQYIFSDYETNVLLSDVGANGVVKYYGNETEQGFVVGTPTNYVKQYDGGFTVGFAKTGGTAGDTIQVYVPHNS